jgi:hypothetical protein
MINGLAAFFIDSDAVFTAYCFLLTASCLPLEAWCLQLSPQWAKVKEF